MTESQLKINVKARILFGDLARDLEQNGQIVDVVRDEDGMTLDGIKREMLLGREQVRFKVVPKNSATYNIHRLDKAQRKEVVKYCYLQLRERYGSMEAKDLTAKRYGISLRTVERDLNPDLTTFVATSKVSNKNHMYEDTKTWNPFVGCQFDCSYCEPSFKRQLKRQKKRCIKCYSYALHEHSERLNPEKIPNEKTVFVCGDSDVSFCNPNYFRKIIETMKQDKKPGRIWLLQSKNPSYFKQFLPDLPKNTVLLTTLETNRDVEYDKASKAPLPSARYEDFMKLDYPRKIITIEPIMDFDLHAFVDWILRIYPEAVFIGYNSHPNELQLNEPSMEKTLDLIVALKGAGIRVLTKELRKMAYKDLFQQQKS